MGKVCRILWLSVAAAALLLLLMCFGMLICCDFDPFYELDRPYEDALEIQRSAFGGQYSCLEFVDGLLVHGKDTSTVAKFNVKKEDDTWGGLSNLIYSATAHNTVINEGSAFILQNNEIVMSDVWLEKLMVNGEKVLEEFVNDRISLYISKDGDGATYLYVKGVHIPARQDDRNVHFKRRNDDGGHL